MVDKKIIKEHTKESISLDYIANKMAFSKFYISRYLM